MSQSLLEVVENLHAAVPADPDNTDDDEAIIQALQQAQQALEQKKKKQVHFDGVEMLSMRKGKAPDSILKHPDQVGAAKENQSSAAGPSAPVSRITVSTPVITTTTTRNIPTATDTSNPEYRYSTPDDSPAVYSRCVIHDPDSTDDLRVGHDSISLRLIFPLIEGKLTIECILDSGCQIVAMNSVI
jgi:hypothetical protein